MGILHLEDMEFYAYHGCYKEEQLTGNWFLVNLTLETNLDKASETDKITDTLNYHTVYELVKEEMQVKSHLLENIAKRILDALFKNFVQLEKASVKVSKLNPPMGGKMRG